MTQDKDLDFLCNKIKQLRTATFTDFSTALLKFPVSVIQLAATDEDGSLWFAVKTTYPCTADFEQSFPAQLHFYNKYFNYRIAAHGKASIIANAQETPSTNFDCNNTMQQYAVIAFKILSAEYFCSQKSNNIHLKEFIKSMIDRILNNEEPVLFKF